MGGTNQQDSAEAPMTESTTAFVWDESSQLYYHASTGFYHDPIGGWYYSSNDGLYYKFENGNYVLLESDQQGVNPEMYSHERTAANNFAQDEHCSNDQCPKIDESKSEMVGSLSYGPNSDESLSIENKLPGNLPPPSEWLEDTLFELYLSGYSNQATSDTSDKTMLAQPNDTDQVYMLADGAGKNDIREVEEGEWLPDDKHNLADSSANVLDEDEERWRAQYGQATHPNEESASNIRLVDLWDWTTVEEIRKHGKGQTTKLVGRLVKRSEKLHPSMPSGGALFKTAPVCKVHLDLVQVRSGQIYRLRSPSAKYLASTSTYDSSNPTKDWPFPPLSISEHTHPLHEIGGKCESILTEGLTSSQGISLTVEQLLEMKRTYRDRAAERRTLHGGFGIGPGQKKSQNGVDSTPSSPTCLQEAAAESFSLSFGAGSYGRRMLESMGWKEGEALGSSTKGLTEPLQAIGNRGNAGIGWDENRR